MEKLYLKYPLLVEGKYDKLHLSNLVASPIITSNGFALFNSEQKKTLVKKLIENSPILVLTDSDKAGNFIRGRLKGLFPVDKLINIYAPQVKGKEKRKSTPSKDGFLGVEGIEAKTLYELLLPFTQNGQAGKASPVLPKDLYNDGFSGGSGSKEQRDRLATVYGLPTGLSTKALLEAINLLGTKQDYEEAKQKIN